MHLQGRRFDADQVFASGRGGERHPVLSLSPGTVATEMQRQIKSSGINPVSQLAWEDHIPADWPAKTLLWMCGDDANEFLGDEVSLRLDLIRRRVGLI